MKDAKAIIAIILILVAFEVYRPLGISLAIIALVSMTIYFYDNKEKVLQ